MPYHSRKRGHASSTRSVALLIWLSPRLEYCIGHLLTHQRHIQQEASVALQKDITIPDLTGRLAVVTGANSGLGFGVSGRLAAAGAGGILAVRNPTKGNQAAADIRAAHPDAQVAVELLDLASLASVERFATALRKQGRPLNLLINRSEEHTSELQSHSLISYAVFC